MVGNYVCISEEIRGSFERKRVATTFEVGDYLFAGGMLPKDDTDSFRQICSVLEIMAAEQQLTKVIRARSKQTVGGFDCCMPENNNNLWQQIN